MEKEYVQRKEEAEQLIKCLTEKPPDVNKCEDGKEKCTNKEITGQTEEERKKIDLEPSKNKQTNKNEETNPEIPCEIKNSEEKLHTNNNQQAALEEGIQNVDSKEENLKKETDEPRVGEIKNKIKNGDKEENGEKEKSEKNEKLGENDENNANQEKNILSKADNNKNEDTTKTDQNINSSGYYIDKTKNNYLEGTQKSENTNIKMKKDSEEDKKEENKDKNCGICIKTDKNRNENLENSNNYFEGKAIIEASDKTKETRKEKEADKKLDTFAECEKQNSAEKNIDQNIDKNDENKTENSMKDFATTSEETKEIEVNKKDKGSMDFEVSSSNSKENKEKEQRKTKQDDENNEVSTNFKKSRKKEEINEDPKQQHNEECSSNAEKSRENKSDTDNKNINEFASSSTECKEEKNKKEDEQFSSDSQNTRQKVESKIDKENLNVEQPSSANFEIDEEDPRIEKAFEKLKEIHSQFTEVQSLLDNFNGTKLENAYFILNSLITELMVGVDEISHQNNQKLKDFRKELHRKLNIYSENFEEKCRNAPSTLTKEERDGKMNEIKKIENELKKIAKEIKQYKKENHKQIDENLFSLFMKIKQIDGKTDLEVENKRNEIIRLVQNEMYNLSQKNEKET